jgi:hypothetical protein
MLRNPGFHCRVQNRRQHNPVFSTMKLLTQTVLFIQYNYFVIFCHLLLRRTRGVFISCFPTKTLKHFSSAPVVQHAPSFHFHLCEKHNSISLNLGSNTLLRNMVWSAIRLFFSIKVREKFHLLLACNFDLRGPPQIYAFCSNLKGFLLIILLRFCPALC